MAKNTDIDFIFRPHPLLFTQLAKEDCWGETKTQVHLDKVCTLIMLLTLRKVIIWKFLPILLHLYTIVIHLRQNTFIRINLVPFYIGIISTQSNVGQSLRKNVSGCIYGIYNAKDLDTFIESVRNGQDTLKEHRIAFAKNEVMINYPHATQKIYENLVQSIFDKKE